MEETSFLTKEKLLGLHKHKHFKWGVFFLFLVIFLDLAFLNYKVLIGDKAPQGQGVKVGNETQGMDSEQATAATSQDTCGQNCISEINKAVSSAVSSQGDSNSQSPSSSSPVQEYFIPLGSGVISSTSWQTVSGLQANIDGSAYGNIQTATFEISVSVPTGNQTANFQLYNSTLSHPVWNSNVSFTGGGTPQLLISSPISLDPGSNLYIVQAQTQLQFPAYITQARVHIITQ